MAEPFYKCRLVYVTFNGSNPADCLEQLAEYLQDNHESIDVDDLVGTVFLRQHDSGDSNACSWIGDWTISAGVNHA